MTGERNFREEARSARLAARRTLLAYREARRRSRGTGAVDPDDLGPGAARAEDGTAIGPESFFAMPPTTAGAVRDPTVEPSARQASEGAGETSRDAPETPTTASSRGASAEEAAIDVSDTASSAAEAQPAVLDAPDGVADPGTAQGPVDEPQDDDPLAGADAEAQPTGLATVDPASDLFGLPGAGAGMISMFHQCGIRSLDDLAKADSRDLSLRLGVVGHILNVEPWIVFARENRQTGR